MGSKKILRSHILTYTFTTTYDSIHSTSTSRMVYTTLAERHKDLDNALCATPLEGRSTEDGDVLTCQIRGQGWVIKVIPFTATSESDNRWHLLQYSNNDNIIDCNKCHFKYKQHPPNPLTHSFPSPSIQTLYYDHRTRLLNCACMGNSMQSV